MVGIVKEKEYYAPGENVPIYFNAPSLWMGTPAWKYHIKLYTSNVPYINSKMTLIDEFEIAPGDKVFLTNIKMPENELHVIALFRVYDSNRNDITGYDKDVASITTFKPLSSITGTGSLSMKLLAPSTAERGKLITVKALMENHFPRRVKIAYIAYLNGKRIQEGAVTFSGESAYFNIRFKMPAEQAVLVVNYTVYDANSNAKLQPEMKTSAVIKDNIIYITPVPKNPEPIPLPTPLEPTQPQPTETSETQTTKDAKSLPDWILLGSIGTAILAIFLLRRG